MAVLIFDYDGTIHDSMRIYAPAVRACHRKLSAEGLLPDGEVTDRQIRSFLGLTAGEMWKQFAPALSQEQHEAGSQYIYREMSRLILEGQAKLYDGALEVLKKLKAQGHRLVFLSNCSEGYMSLHTRVFGLDRYFDEMYCSGLFAWAEKWQIVQQLLPGWQLLPVWAKEPMIIAIGDRYKDMEIEKAGSRDSKPVIMIKTVFCKYGFGEASEGSVADAAAASVTEVPECISKLIRNSLP